MTKTDELLREFAEKWVHELWSLGADGFFHPAEPYFISDLRKLIAQVEEDRMPSEEEREQSEKANKGIRLEKHIVCASCFSVGITDKDCVCAYSNGYPTIELEFEVCDSCGRIINDGNPADTPFNKEQFKRLSEKE